MRPCLILALLLVLVGCADPVGPLGHGAYFGPCQPDPNAPTPISPDTSCH